MTKIFDCGNGLAQRDIFKPSDCVATMCWGILSNVMKVMYSGSFERLVKFHTQSNRLDCLPTKQFSVCKILRILGRFLEFSVHMHTATSSCSCLGLWRTPHRPFALPSSTRVVLFNPRCVLLS